jgi:Domain of unknown function (DUF222)
MSGSVVDEAVMRQAREVMEAARRADHAVLCEVARLQSTGVAEATGYRSTERLVQDLWRVDLGEARRLVRQARALCEQITPTGAPVEPRLSATAAAAAAGTLDRGHVRVIDEAVRYLERVVEGIDPAALREAEEFLVEHAASLAPRGLARAAARLIAALDQDGVAPEDEAEPTDEVRIGRRRDGSLVLKGRFTGRADIQLILAAFDALSGRAGSDDHRELETRYAATLLELCGLAMAPGGIGDGVAPSDRAAPGETTGPVERGAGDPRHLRPDLRHPDDIAREERAREDLAQEERLRDEAARDDAAPRHNAAPDEAARDDVGREECTADSDGDAVSELWRPRAPGRALLTVTMPYTWLREQIGHGLVGAEEAISAAEARRLTCDAGIVPVVLGTRSEPLDVGRLSYTVTEAQRRALFLRDQGCAFSDCTRRPERCHAHHVEHWCDGGHTCLGNLCLLCSFHHRLIHHGDWQVTMINGRPWFIPPTWLDPEQKPRLGGPAI